MTGRDLLLVIGSNPPSGTSGVRTLARVEAARQVLGFNNAALCNLFPLASHRSGGLAELGTELAVWEGARGALVESIARADGLVLAYGVQEPTGQARRYFRAQVAWLEEQITARRVPVWWVGGQPRHPSRWQRHTWRACLTSVSATLSR